MAIRITTLTENTAGMPFILGEWGLSVVIEADGTNILFDTGQLSSAAYNTDALGIDLAKMDRIVISHGHHDHTGGFQQVLRKIRKEIEVIAHPDMWAAKYARRPGGPDAYCGIPFLRRELENLGARFTLTSEPVKLAENITTTGEVPMVTGFEEIEPGRFWVKEGDGMRPDELLDDQAIVITTEAGLVVILGCAHRGIINTLYHAQKLTGVEKIHTVIGGCHLTGCSEERLWLTIAALRELGIERLGVSHCTGLPAAAVMANEFGESFFFNNAGTRIQLP